MTNAKRRPTPEWVTRLLQACTRPEQFAIGEYRCHLAKCHARHTRGLLNRSQVTRIWTKELTKLEAQACGTPRYDHYVSRQHHHLEEFTAGVATQGRSA